jgi:hypothetical protein
VGGGEPLRLPWHILPRKAADTRAVNRLVNLDPQGVGTLEVRNTKGATAGGVNVFDWTGSSPQDYVPPAAYQPDLRDAGVRAVQTRSGPLLQFGISTYGERSHIVEPAEFDDYILFTADLGFLTGNVTGQSAVWLVDASAGTIVDGNPATTAPDPFFFTDGDLNAGNLTLTIPMAALGLEPGVPFEYLVFSFDAYFGTGLTDFIDDNGFWMLYTPGLPRFETDVLALSVPRGGTATLNVNSVTDGDLFSPSQRGFLLLYQNALPGRWGETVEVQ